ncbi:MAG: uncharacterized protein KVP18_004454 [Porospora cf. gigantea A]|uniref:uncharacterized protein n=1 Tax=Porospora cf. gigantea A TaxID=2853593 RepID=UPI00355985E9|nr:MAG: hypothetical protein KVP18_004454 [Porospora cf. gigantea A]
MQSLPEEAKTLSRPEESEMQSGYKCPACVPPVRTDLVPPYSTSPIPAYNRLTLSELEASSSPWSPSPSDMPPAEGNVSVVVGTPQSDRAISLRSEDAASPAVASQHPESVSADGAADDGYISLAAGSPLQGSHASVADSPTGCHVSLAVGSLPSDGCVPLLQPFLIRSRLPSAEDAASPAVASQHPESVSADGAADDGYISLAAGPPLQGTRASVADSPTDCHVSLAVGSLPSDGCVPLLEPLLSGCPHPSPRKLGIVQRFFLRLKHWWRWFCGLWRRTSA